MKALSLVVCLSIVCSICCAEVTMPSRVFCHTDALYGTNIPRPPCPVRMVLECRAIPMYPTADFWLGYEDYKPGLPDDDPHQSLPVFVWDIGANNRVIGAKYIVDCVASRMMLDLTMLFYHTVTCSSSPVDGDSLTFIASRQGRDYPVSITFHDHSELTYTYFEISDYFADTRCFDRAETHTAEDYAEAVESLIYWSDPLYYSDMTVTRDGAILSINGAMAVSESGSTFALVGPTLPAGDTANPQLLSMPEPERAMTAGPQQSRSIIELPHREFPPPPPFLSAWMAEHSQ